MTNPYRAAATPNPSRPRELVVHARERDRNSAVHRVWIGAGLFGTFGAVVCTLLGAPELGWLPLAVAFVWYFVSWRRTVGGRAIKLRVDGGQLTVADVGGRVLLDVPLERLLDVQLDTKAITPARRNTAVETLGIGMHSGGTLDVSRVVLVPMEPRAPLPLGDEEISHMDAVEMASQIRRFLRSHAWLPEDERA